MIEVIDKYGKRVTRADGILQHGDRIRVPMTLIDAANSLALRDASAQLEQHQLAAFADAVNGGMSLADAIAKAKGLKRIEQFDARGHRPGFATQDAGDAGDAGVSARDAYIARTGAAWKSPPAVLDANRADKPAAGVPPTASNEQLFAARDAAVAARDKRIENAWKS